MAGLDKVVDLFLQFIDSFYLMCVIDHRERGVMMLLGRPWYDLEPGPHFRLPFQIGTIKRIVVKQRTDDLVAQSLTTSDDKCITLSICVTYDIENYRYVLLECDDLDGIIRDSCVGEVGEFVGGLTYEELRGIGSHRRLTNAIRKRLGEYGVKVHRVQVAEFVKSRQFRIWTGM